MIRRPWCGRVVFIRTNVNRWSFHCVLCRCDIHCDLAATTADKLNERCILNNHKHGQDMERAWNKHTEDMDMALDDVAQKAT